MGLISPDDVVLIKVNAQWKCGAARTAMSSAAWCTESSDIRTASGEVVILDNGQGRGSLACDIPGTGTARSANAVDESHSFLYLVDHVFHDPRVSAFLLDPIRFTFIGGDDHVTDGYAA